MKRVLNTALFGLFVAVFATGCADFVQGIEDPIDQIADPLLTSEAQVPFLENGIKQRFSLGYSQTLVLAEGLSDAFRFGGSNATFPTFEQAATCDFLTDNNSSTNALLRVGQFAYLADNLIERIDAIGTFENAATRTSALFTAQMYAGLARFMYATYYGLGPTEGGGFDVTGQRASPFVPSANLYGIAITRFNQALEHASAGQARTVQSLKARTYLYNGEFGNALTAVSAGMTPDDEPFQALYTPESANEWFFSAGVGRSQLIPVDRFAGYVEEDEDEAARVRLVSPANFTGLIQNVYPELGSPIPVIDWQENFLMGAELAIRTGAATVTIGGTTYTPLELVNEVRESHGISPLASVDLDVIYEERDKELFARGQRLADNRRFNDFDHCTGPWRYIVITERETNNNDAL
jgi:starch-binding outer membrane protein, SusD/RagB family